MTNDAFDHVLWLGGMGGVGKTTAARAIARRYDLRLYSVDSYTYEHAARLPPEPPRSLDEIWVDSSPEDLATWFNDQARVRFPLILDDLSRLPSDAPILAEGPQMLPELVQPLLRSPDRAVFVEAAHDLHRRLLLRRGSGLVKLVRDPGRALENRIRRDQILAEWLRRDLQGSPLGVMEVADLTEIESGVERRFAAALSEWDARGDRGDVAGRRRDENDARLRQWRANANRVGDASGEVAFACECSRYGCVETLTLGLAEADGLRVKSQPFVVSAHA